MAKQAETGVQYSAEDRLEVVVRLYLDKSAMRLHDVDNRLKDILDALQGRAGGSKAVRRLPAIVPNDWQIFRALIEKEISPKQGRGMGHLLVRKFSPSRPG